MNIEIGKWYLINQTFSNAFDGKIVKKNWFTYTVYYKLYYPKSKLTLPAYCWVLKRNIMEELKDYND